MPFRSRSLILCAAFFVALLHRQPAGDVSKSIIQGIVISGQDGKPVINAHAFVIDGEEEALTNNKGEFSIESWQQTPLVLTVERQGYEKIKLTVTVVQQKQIIRLKKNHR